MNSSEWAESRRRPESYVSRIWKGPSFLPGIIENRCRLSLYADQHSLTREGKSFLPFPPLPSFPSWAIGAFTTAKRIHPGLFSSIPLIATPSPLKRPGLLSTSLPSSLFPVHSTDDGRRWFLSHRYKRRCKGNLKSTRWRNVRRNRK